MAENRKYYWLKLKDSFFTDKRIKKLRKIAGGDTYTIIYLKMQLLSLKDEGNLYFDNIENTFEEEIALQIDEDLEDVKLAIAYLLRTELLVILSNNQYELPETKTCIGSETRNAESMRILREKRKQDVTLLQDVTKSYTEIEKDIEIEKEKDIDNTSSEVKTSTDDKKHKYGEYKNVLLKDSEYEKLKEEYLNADELIKFLDEYIEMKGYKAKSHYLCIKKWVVDAVKQNNTKDDKKTKRLHSKDLDNKSEEYWNDFYV